MYPYVNAKMISRLKQTFMSLVFGFALRARLISILPLIFVAWSTNRECTDIASNKGFAINRHSNIITTDLAGMTTQILQGLTLKKQRPNPLNSEITK